MEKTFVYETSIGPVGISENGKGITALFVVGDWKSPDQITEETPLLKKAAVQLKEYLAGKRQVFDLSLDPQGTEFQKKVWKALEEIPYGELRSYKDIAIAVGNPKGSRAIGMANNRNPIAIVVPCHRVVGSNGKLVGYAYGLGMKDDLLQLEKAHG